MTTLASSGQTTPLGWQGQSGAYTDSETGLVKLGFRYYAPALGRFISRDPSGFSGGVNLYGYCSGDPVNVCDASGLDEPNLQQQIVEGFQEDTQAILGAPQAAGQTVFHHGLAAANAGLAMDPNAATFGHAWTDGSKEAEYVNGRFRHIGNAVGNGIDQMGGMAVAELAGAALGQMELPFEELPPKIVYRALREGEDPAMGLVARNPGIDLDPARHVAGVRESPWISTTGVRANALYKYGSKGQTVVAIDLSKVTNEIVDFSGGIPGKRGRVSNYAKSDLEHLIRDHVPASAITIIRK